MQQQIDEWLKVLAEKSNRLVVRFGDREIKYILEPGRKYTRVVKEESRKYNPGKWNESKTISKSVHAFIDNLNGDIYKASGWKAPAKNGARFNVVNDIETLIKVCDEFGSYLYKKR